jgi:hypothetical protein
MTKKTTFTITLRRTDGRFVKATQRHSKYAVKKVVEAWEEKYPDCEIEVE